MKTYQTYALPLGSAFVAVILLDHIISLDCLMKETFLYIFADNEFHMDFIHPRYIMPEFDSLSAVMFLEAIFLNSYDRDDFPFFYLTVRALLSLALWFVLFMGPSRILFLWIIISVIIDSLRHGNVQMIYNALKSFDVYLFLVMPSIRIYNIFITIEVARILEKRRGSDENLDEEEICDLLPVSKGVDYFCVHYKQFSSLTAIMLLTTDIVWNFVLLPTMKSSLGSLGGFIFVALGIALDVAAISFIRQKLSFSFSCWKILYALFLFTIFIIFSTVLTDIRKHPSSLEYISTFTFATLLVFRSFVLFCCLRCKLYPVAFPTVPTTSPSETESVNNDSIIEPRSTVVTPSVESV